MQMPIPLDRSSRTVITSAHHREGSNQLAASSAGRSQNMCHIGLGDTATIHNLHLITCRELAGGKSDRGCLLSNLHRKFTSGSRSLGRILHAIDLGRLGIHLKGQRDLIALLDGVPAGFQNAVILSYILRVRRDREDVSIKLGIRKADFQVGFSRYMSQCAFTPAAINRGFIIGR